MIYSFALKVNQFFSVILYRHAIVLMFQVSVFLRAFFFLFAEKTRGNVSLLLSFRRDTVMPEKLFVVKSWVE